MARELKTGWVILATSGNTVDGREIEKSWLKEIAKNYNPKRYQAMIWPDHFRFMPVGGKVLTLKTEKATDPDLEGEIHLWGILSPNDWLIQANREGQYVFPSIEIQEDFMGRGEMYMRGLGVTSNPASAGTQELKFSAGQVAQTYSCDRNMNLIESIEQASSSNQNFFSRWLNRDDQPETEEETMNEEQRKAFQSQILDGVKGVVTDTVKSEFANQMKEFTDKGAGKAGGDGGSNSASDESDNEETVPAKEFNELQTKHDDLQTKFEALEKKVESFSNTAAGGATDVPEGEQEGDDFNPLY